MNGYNFINCAIVNSTNSSKINQTRLTNGGTISLMELVPYLFKACKNNPKGVFSNILNRLKLKEISYKDSQGNNNGSFIAVAGAAGVGATTSLSKKNTQQIQKHFICMKLLMLIAYSRIDLNNMALKTEERELQLDMVLMYIEESLDIKIKKREITIFKKCFDNFLLVPFKHLESKINYYTNPSAGAAGKPLPTPS